MDMDMSVKRGLLYGVGTTVALGALLPATPALMFLGAVLLATGIGSAHGSSASLREKLGKVAKGVLCGMVAVALFPAAPGLLILGGALLAASLGAKYLPSVKSVRNLIAPLINRMASANSVAKRANKLQKKIDDINNKYRQKGEEVKSGFEEHKQYELLKWGQNSPTALQNIKTLRDNAQKQIDEFNRLARDERKAARKREIKRDDFRTQHKIVSRVPGVTSLLVR